MMEYTIPRLNNFTPYVEEPTPTYLIWRYPGGDVPDNVLKELVDRLGYDVRLVKEYSPSFVFEALEIHRSEKREFLVTKGHYIIITPSGVVRVEKNIDSKFVRRSY